MNKYELIYIVDARLTDAEKGDVAKLLADMIVKHGGKVVSSAVWFERQKMSFPIGKVIEGTYYLLNVDGKPLEMEKLRREMQISERILRFLIVKMNPSKAV
ncbi:MAG: 30S ribosomal protein S6 [Candidatus Omnitrophota bacterium]